MADAFHLEVLFEHQDFFIVYKPQGIGFHDDENQVGFFNLCQQFLGENLFPVHRLDKITSGLLVLAKNKDAAIWFQQAFEQKRIHKFYLALSASKPNKKQGSIIGDMVKARSSQWRLTKSKQNPAVSRFTSWGFVDVTTALRLFLIKPETGKTHQIRVALKSVGSAIFGDELYSGEKADRGYLHAFAIEFDYQGEIIRCQAMPKSGKSFIEHIDEITDKLQDWQSIKWPK